jgi:hypothetical protein
MSTFTRLYFVDRGPGIAAQDDHDPQDEADGEIGSPNIAPADHIGDSQQAPDSGRLPLFDAHPARGHGYKRAKAGPALDFGREPDAGESRDDLDRQD